MTRGMRINTYTGVRNVLAKRPDWVKAITVMVTGKFTTYYRSCNTTLTETLVIEVDITEAITYNFSNVIICINEALKKKALDFNRAHDNYMEGTLDSIDYYLLY